MAIPFRFPNHNGRLTRPLLSTPWDGFDTPAHDGFFGGTPPDFPVEFVPAISIEVLDQVGDIRFALEDGESGVDVLQNDIERDAGLETAVSISLFTDRRASKGEVLPDGSGDRRGWWGDVTQSDEIGSKAWLLGRSKMTPTFYEEYKAHQEEALAWMIADGVVASVTITVVPDGAEEIDFTVLLVRPENGDSISFRYFYNWEAQTFRRF